MGSERLLSVGLDVGTTSTQLVVSELTVENRAGSFSVPDLAIGARKLLYKSPVHFTPLLGGESVDGDGIRRIVEQEYRSAGITRQQVDTGAVIITGETSRKENARAVVSALAELAGDFVVATAGPDLESVLAAKGAGAVRFSGETGKRVLHMDIGGGTSNLALIEDGTILKTGCMNVGGRLIKVDETGKVTYVSPVLEKLCKLKSGEKPSVSMLEEVARLLTEGLEMAAGLRETTPLLEQLWTREAGEPWHLEEDAVFSFSGGVADCIEKEQTWNAFGDIGPLLGQAIRKSRLCAGAYRLGEQTIRATVIGAGCHSAQLSGSTVFYKNVTFPLKNLRVMEFSPFSQDLSRLEREDGDAVLALQLPERLNFSLLERLAEKLAELGNKPLYVALEQDAAKALGQALSLRLRRDRPCMCIDRLRLLEGSFLDVGAPVGPALPVVIKTLILQQ